MNTELICVGTELLEGKLNTNSSYIGEKLSTLGLALEHIVTVGDNPAHLESVLSAAIERSAVVVVTGGLGPTFDDITREAASKVTGRKLVLNREALSAIARMFVKRGIDMPRNNERQAYILEGAKILQNPAGTAPGQLLELEKPGPKNTKQKVFLFILPGPPREMQGMFDREVFPLLKKFETIIRKSFTLHICGLGESMVDDKIRAIVDAERKLDAGSVSFTILAHQMIVDIKTSVSGKDEMLVDEMTHNIKDEFYEALGENIYGEDSASLEGVVGGLLMKNKSTLAVAESCTGGLLSQKITSVPGSSFYFRQGFVVYSNQSKTKMLGVKEETLEKFGAVSEEAAAEMAAGAKSVSGADYALSITGVAGPSGGTAEKPVGLVYIGITGPALRRVVKATQWSGSRSEIRERSANQALDILRRSLLEMEVKKEPKRKTRKK